MTGQNRRTAAFFLSGLLFASSLLGGSARAAALTAEELVPVGHTIGIKLFAEGVVVIGLAEVETGNGLLTPGADCGLQVGDVIEAANGREIESSEQFAELTSAAVPWSWMCPGTERTCSSRQSRSRARTAPGGWEPGFGTAWRVSAP